MSLFQFHTPYGFVEQRPHTAGQILHRLALRGGEVIEDLDLSKLLARARKALRK